MLNLAPEQTAITQQALTFFGNETQCKQAMEEAGELTAACNHFLRERLGADKELASEIADMRIMLEQLTSIVGEDLVNEEIAFKLDRLQDRVGHIVVGSKFLDAISVGGTD